MIKVKRVYYPIEKDDGVRILVDRIWPRGIKKNKIDMWLKDIAPSNELKNGTIMILINGKNLREYILMN